MIRIKIFLEKKFLDFFFGGFYFLIDCSYTVGTVELSAAEGSCFGAEAGEGGGVGCGGEILGVERGAGEGVFVGVNGMFEAVRGGD